MTHSSFNSHVNVTEALEMFAAHNIIIEKKKCGASGINQSYDHQQTVAEKRASQQLLDVKRTQMSQRIDQHKLVRVVLDVMTSLSASIWAIILYVEEGMGDNNNDRMDDEEMDVVDEAFQDVAHGDLMLVKGNGFDPEEERAEVILNAKYFVKERDQHT
eukprot:13612218-Ditylum_brightwellii.AAC.1